MASASLSHIEIKIASLQSKVFAGEATEAIRDELDKLLAQREEMIRELTPRRTDSLAAPSQGAGFIPKASP